MWKKGELVWVRLDPSDSWTPGQISDPSKPFGILVSFFDLMEPRYVPNLCLRSFVRSFRSLVPDAFSFRHFVNRALETHSWNISFRLWCPCQQPIDWPYLVRDVSLPCSPLRSDSALGFVREMAVLKWVPLRRFVDTNNFTAQIRSFRRYTVDFKRSESIYEEARESVNLMNGAEELDWCLDPSNNQKDCIDDLFYMFPETSDSDVDSNGDCLGDPLPKYIHYYSVDQPVAEEVQSLNTTNPLIDFRSVIRACVTNARASNHEDTAHSLRSRERCQDEESICLPNSESPFEDIIEEDDATDSFRREAPPDVMIETHDDIIRSDDRTVTSASNDGPLLAKPVSFVVLEGCKNLACSVGETSVNPRSKFDSSVISANTLAKDRSDGNHFNGTRKNCPDDDLESHFVDVGQASLDITGSSNKEFGSDDAAIAPAEQLQGLEVATKTSEVDNIRSIGVKRKASRDKAYKRRKKASQQSISDDKPQNLQLLKALRLAEPKCLRMKFLSTHVNLPSKSELLKRFSVFGKIDASRIDVNPGESSAKVVFLQSIDAVTAFQFARSKKFKLGWSKVVYRLDAFEKDVEVNKVPVSQKPQESVPSPRSCLKKHGSA